MLLVTDYNYEAEKFYYAAKGQENEAYLAVLKKAWKKFFAKWPTTADPQALRYHFVQEDWDMATLDDALVAALPETMKKKVEQNRLRYRNGLARLERKAEMVRAAKALVEAPKDEALKMTIKVDGKNRPLAQVVAEELNKFLQEATNDGYNATELFTIQKTEKL
jgi:hypothetical protein